ncbi:MAG: nucleotide pyrophosphohydrolase [Betaproteobacteria bacterium]|nr:nucleotide pyrophosphohydrolase [Betaproteobacteria bacterium]
MTIPVPAASPPPDSLDDLRERLRRFSAERDWEQYHTPKNLAMSVAIEAAEIMEHFQWLTVAQSANLDEAARHDVALEIADVLLYLVRLADVLDIDMAAAAREKIGLNAHKYPARRGL